MRWNKRQRGRLILLSIFIAKLDLIQVLENSKSASRKCYRYTGKDNRRLIVRRIARKGSHAGGLQERVQRILDLILPLYFILSVTMVCSSGDWFGGC